MTKKKKTYSYLCTAKNSNVYPNKYWNIDISEINKELSGEKNYKL